MNAIIRKTARIIATGALCMSLIPVSLVLAQQPYSQGMVAPEFSLPNWEDGTMIRLSDFEGQILVIDFFAFWCPICAYSAAEVEEGVGDYYRERDGNPSGVPVRVLSVNIEEEDRAATDSFIQTHGLGLVGDDSELKVWNRFSETGSVPLFVVINGLAHAEGLEQWEILHAQPGYPGVELLREIIDGVRPRSGPFSALPDAGDGWRRSPWYGWVHNAHDPWVYSADHAWQYFLDDGSGKGWWVYDPVISWMWTHSEYYPLAFSVYRNTWMRFESRTQEGMRRFYDYALENPVLFDAGVAGDCLDWNDFRLTSLMVSPDMLRHIAGRDHPDPIMNPRFVTSDAASEAFMNDYDTVLGVAHEGVARAYPFHVLEQHKLVNDRIAGFPVAIAYAVDATGCPMCGSIAVVERRFNGRELTFGMSGISYAGFELLYDHETQSLWHQLSMRSIAGPLVGGVLERVPFSQKWYYRWVEESPDGEVLAPGADG